MPWRLLAVAAEPVFCAPQRRKPGICRIMRLCRPDLWTGWRLPMCARRRNPQGAVADAAYWRDLMRWRTSTIFAFSLMIVIPRFTATPRLRVLWKWPLTWAPDPERVLSFHSLSKRSNPARPAVGPSWPGVPDSIRAFFGNCAPMRARPWPNRCNMLPPRLGRMKRMSTGRAALYQQKYALANRVFANVPGYQPRKVGFSCGCQWQMAKRPRALVARNRDSRSSRRLSGAGNKTARTPNKGFVRVAHGHAD